MSARRLEFVVHVRCGARTTPVPSWSSEHAIDLAISEIESGADEAVVQGAASGFVYARYRRRVDGEIERVAR